MNLSTQRARDRFRWPVSATSTINTPASELWRVISSPDSLLPSHPFLTDNPVKHWGGADSRDKVHYLRGLVYRRVMMQHVCETPCIPMACKSGPC